MRIHDFPGFPNPVRVRIALAEKGLSEQVEFLRVDVPTGAHKQPEFLALNPSGTVPVLELDDGSVITECSAITEYLDHLVGEPELTGRGAEERARIHMVQRRMEDGVLDAIAAYFHHATPGLGPDIEGEQLPRWGELQREKALRNMALVNGALKSQAYVAGDHFTIADITLLAGLLFAGFAQISVPEDLVHLHAWHEEIRQRASVEAVLRSQ